MANPLCSDCGTRHAQGRCPMMDGVPAKGSKKKPAKPKGENKTLRMIIAAHQAHWFMIGEVSERHGFRKIYVSTWVCTVCSDTWAQRSFSQGTPPPPRKHPAVYKQEK